MIDGLRNVKNQLARRSVDVVKTCCALNGIRVSDLRLQSAITVVGNLNGGSHVGSSRPALIVVTGFLDHIGVGALGTERNRVEACYLAHFGFNRAEHVSRGLAFGVGLVQVEGELFTGLGLGTAVDGLVHLDGGCAFGFVGVREQSCSLIVGGSIVANRGAQAAVGVFRNGYRSRGGLGISPTLAVFAELLDIVLVLTSLSELKSFEGNGFACFSAFRLKNLVAALSVEGESEFLALHDVRCTRYFLMNAQRCIRRRGVGVVEACVLGFGLVVLNGNGWLLRARGLAHAYRSQDIQALGPLFAQLIRLMDP